MEKHKFNPTLLGISLQDISRATCCQIIAGGEACSWATSQTTENGTPHPVLFWLWNVSTQMGRDVSATPHSPGMLHTLTTAATKGVGYFSAVYKTNRGRKKTKQRNLWLIQYSGEKNHANISVPITRFIYRKTVNRVVLFKMDCADYGKAALVYSIVI